MVNSYRSVPYTLLDRSGTPTDSPRTKDLNDKVLYAAYDIFLYAAYHMQHFSTQVISLSWCNQ